MELDKIAKGLHIIASDDHCFLVFKNKDAKNSMVKVPCIKGEPVEDIIKRHKSLEDKLGKIRDVMDAQYKSIMPAKPVEKFFKVTFGTSSGSKHVETLPYEPLPHEPYMKIPLIIEKAVNSYKSKNNKDKLSNVLGIENEEGVLIFDPIRDLARRFK